MEEIIQCGGTIVLARYIRIPCSDDPLCTINSVIVAMHGYLFQMAAVKKLVGSMRYMTRSYLSQDKGLGGQLLCASISGAL